MSATHQPGSEVGAASVPGPRGAGEETSAGRFAGFELIRELGRGAATVVYHARRDGTDYALKATVDRAPDGGRVLTAFRREAALTARIQHQGLPRVHEVGEHAGRPYLAMDLVDGVPLSVTVEGGPMPEDAVLRLGIDLAGALAAVHRLGLVHRDVKPANVLVTPGGDALLIDFGLAGHRDGGEDDEAAVGTLVYAAPEQSRMLARVVDGRADLYSLGVVLFECLTGAPPFVSDDVGELLRMHAVAAPPDVRSQAPGTSAALAAVLAALLAKDPDDRYTSGADLLADLRRVAGHGHGADFRPVLRGTDEEQATDAPLRGRTAELVRLLNRWEGAAGGTPAAVLLTGPAGIGKTRLARELARHVRALGGLTLRGSSAADDTLPLAPLRAAVESHLNSVARLPEPAREAARQAIQEAAGPAAALLGSLSPALRALLGDAPATDQGDQQDRFAIEVADFLVRLGRAHDGLLLQLDDVQWLDPGSRRVLRLLRDEADAPVMVVDTARDDDEGPVLAGIRAAPGVEELTVAPLDAAAVADLVLTELPGLAPDSELPRTLSSLAQGNPLVVLEYLRAVVDAGLVVPGPAGWELDGAGLAELDLPLDAAGLVLARIGELPPDARDLLVTAAAVGPRFGAPLLAAVTGTAEAAALDLLGREATRRLVEARDGGEHAFLHERIREALLAELTVSDARQLHARIAAALAAGEGGPATEHAIGHHYLLAGSAADAGPAARACAAAGRLSLREHAGTTAVRFFRHAVDRLDGAGLDVDPELLAELGTALIREGRYPDAREALLRALDLLDDPLRRAAVLTLVAESHRGTWDTAGVIQACERGFEALGRPLPRRTPARVLGALPRALAAWLVARTRIGFGTATGRDRDRFRLLADLHFNAAYAAAVNMRPDQLLVHHLYPTYAVQRLGPGPEYVSVMASVTMLLDATGRRGWARVTQSRSREAAAALGDPRLVAMAEWAAGCDEFMFGAGTGHDWVHALEEHGRWLDLGYYCDAAQSILVQAAFEGRTDDVRRWYERGRRRVAAAHEGQLTSFGPMTAVHEAALGLAGSAGTELQRVERMLPAGASRGLVLNLLLTRAYLLAEEGETGAPVDDLAAALSALGIPPRAMTRQSRAILAVDAAARLARARAGGRGRLPELLQQARTSLATLQSVADTAWLAAQARLSRADLHTLEGDPRQALRTLDEQEQLHPDAPLVAFEAARIRARALRDLGAAADAERQARLAQLVARQHGWAQRVRWVTAEFGLPEASSQTTGAVRVTTSAGTDAVSGRERSRLEALQEVGRATTRVLDPKVLAGKVLDVTVRVLTAERAFLFLTEADDDGNGDGGERLVPYLGRDADGNDLAELTGYSATVVERVRATGEPAVLTGTEQGEALGSESVVLHGLRSIMAAPLRLEGRMLGVVYLDSQVAKGIFTPADAELLTALTTSIATSLETARAAQLEVSVQAARQRQSLAEQLRLAFTRMSVTDPAQVLARLLESAHALLPSTAAWLLQPRSNGGFDVLPLGADEPRRVPPDPAVDRLLAAAAPVPGRAGEDAPVSLAAELPAGGSWLALPLAASTGVVGVVLLAADDPAAFGDAQVEVAGALVGQGMTAYVNAALFSRVQELSVVDELTGIANRRRFFELAGRALDRAAATGHPMSALMIDIDRFKSVNDTHGHGVGDEVIRAVAGRLAATIRSEDVLGRYGGEEFAAMLPDAGPAADLPERLRSAVAATPVDTAAGPLTVTVSIGVALRSPDDADVTALLARADRGLYRAKENGRNRVERA